MRQSAVTGKILVAAGAGLTALTLTADALADDGPGVRIALPSGPVVYWLETLQDRPGGQGLTHRYRFVMPDLAGRVPSTSGPASDFEDERGPIDIDTETDEIDGTDVDADMPDEQMFADNALVNAQSPDTLPVSGLDEEAADALLEAPALPAAPDVLAQDPIHRDIVWLCENWVLPRAIGSTPRPAQIIISLADKEVPFGAFDPDAVQLFEAFQLPPDRDVCEWEPW